MILKSNLVYFQSGELHEKIKEYGKKLWNENYENSVFSGAEDIIEKVNKAQFSFISLEEKETILSLLKKEKTSLNNFENNIFEQKFFFFFALLDFILRENIEHKFFYEENCGYFSGIFSKEIQYIEHVNDTNPISFYADFDGKKPKINFNVKFENLIRNIGKNFISDMLMEDYLELFKRYLKFKKSIENK